MFTRVPDSGLILSHQHVPLADHRIQIDPTLPLRYQVARSRIHCDISITPPIGIFTNPLHFLPVPVPLQQQKVHFHKNIDLIKRGSHVFPLPLPPPMVLLGFRMLDRHHGSNLPGYRKRLIWSGIGS